MQIGRTRRVRLSLDEDKYKNELHSDCKSTVLCNKDASGALLVVPTHMTTTTSVSIHESVCNNTVTTDLDSALPTSSTTKSSKTSGSAEVFSESYC